MRSNYCFKYTNHEETFVVQKIFASFFASKVSKYLHQKIRIGNKCPLEWYMLSALIRIHLHQMIVIFNAILNRFKHEIIALNMGIFIGLLGLKNSKLLLHSLCFLGCKMNELRPWGWISYLKVLRRWNKEGVRYTSSPLSRKIPQRWAKVVLLSRRLDRI